MLFLFQVVLKEKEAMEWKRKYEESRQEVEEMRWVQRFLCPCELWRVTLASFPDPPTPITSNPLNTLPINKSVQNVHALHMFLSWYDTPQIKMRWSGSTVLNPCAVNHASLCLQHMHQPQSTSQSVYLFPTLFLKSSIRSKPIKDGLNVSDVPGVGAGEERE